MRCPRDVSVCRCDSVRFFEPVLGVRALFWPIDISIACGIRAATIAARMPLPQNWDLGRWRKSECFLVETGVGGSMHCFGGISKNSIKLWWQGANARKSAVYMAYMSIFRSFTTPPARLQRIFRGALGFVPVDRNSGLILKTSVERGCRTYAIGFTVL